MNYGTIDDAMHLAFPLKNIEKEFEWWYFDAALDTGDHVVVMYSSNDTRLSPRQPSVRLNIYPPNQAEIRTTNRYQVEDITLCYEKCDVVMGREYCRNMGEYYELYTECDGTGALLKFYPQKPQFSRPEAWWIMGWTVAVPTARVEGYLWKNGEKTEVKGHGYHDHNWGSKPMSCYFKNWYWGKVHTNEYTIDYSVMIPRYLNKPLLALLIIDKDGTICKPTMLGALLQTSVSLEKFSLEETLGHNIPHALHLYAKTKQCEMDLTIALDQFVMKEKSEFATGEDAYRYLGKEVLQLTQSGETKTYHTESLHEIVFLLK